MNRKARLVLSLLGFGLSASAFGATDTPVKANNSEKNQPSVSGTDTSAGDQGNSKSDLELTRKIRRSLTKDSGLSSSAHNVKIISNQGHVVLRGPVDSMKEKEIIEKRVASFLASETMFTSYLEVIVDKK